MQSKFTAMALALAFVTVTALPAMAFTLIENTNPAAGPATEATPPDHQLLDLQMGVVAAPGAPQAAGSTGRWELFFDGSAIELSTRPASPGGTKALSPPENSPVAVFPSRNQPAPQAIIPSAAVVEQKVRLPAMAGPGGGPHIAQSAKPAEFAPRN